MDAGISVYTVGMAIVGTFIVDVLVAMLAIVVAVTTDQVGVVPDHQPEG
jgi:hypothetical protein